MIVVGINGVQKLSLTNKFIEKMTNKLKYLGLNYNEQNTLGRLISRKRKKPKYLLLKNDIHDEIIFNEIKRIKKKR